MRPTRRGLAALAIAALAVAMAWVGGTRALNAVAAPLLVAVIVGAVQVRRAGAPTVERSRPRPGFPGERRSVTLSVDGGGVGLIEDRLPDGLSGTARAERSLPATIEYDLTYERRGERALGPTAVRVRDALGLVESRYEVETETSVLVYPRVYSMGTTASFVDALGLGNDERRAFDRLREYVPGDRLRDVHWKTSAKNDDLLVTEYADPVEDAGIAIAAEGVAGAVDEMAAAAATLFVAATRSGREVALAVPDGSIPEGYGESHQRRALDLLARTGPGEVDPDAWERADVRLRATQYGVAVEIGDREHDLEELTVTRENPLVAEVGP